jgi:L-erythrulose 1-phosphate isomerase
LGKSGILLTAMLTICPCWTDLRSFSEGDQTAAMGDVFWVGTSWKMHKNRADALLFARTLRDAPVIRHPKLGPFVIPPFPYISEVATALSGTPVAVGAQNMHWDDEGPWTGEVSAPMLRDCGASLVEIGHSERRTHFGETDEAVGRKVANSVKNSLTAVVCVGDTRGEFEAGATASVLARQLHFALKHVGKAAIGKVRIAYEPVWSIGTGGIPADPTFANEQHRLLKELSCALIGEPLPILYGGSVNAANCEALASRAHIDGLFIGRAAWDVKGYIDIMEKVAKIRG